MASTEYSFRLEGLPVPTGEISMRDLVNIGDALQLAATRVARQLGGQTGRGRSTGAIDKMSELRLSGISSGSTVLEVHLGNAGTLPLAGSDEAMVAERFEALFTALATNQPPEWANAGVRAAVGKIAAQVSASGASRLIAHRGIGAAAAPLQAVDIRRVKLDSWKVIEERDTERITMTGRLDKVDLRARRFRVRDDVGNDVTLDDVVDVDAAAHLIGHRVVATGIAEREQGRVVRIIEPELALEVLPSEWFEVPSGMPAGAPFTPGTIEGVTDEEIDEFLAEIRG